VDGQAVEVQRDVPVGTVSTVGAVLALALGSGFVAFVGVGLLAWACSWPVKLALGASGVVVLVVWATYIARVYDLFWASESVRPVDQVEGDHVTRSVVSVELHDHDRGRWAFADLPCTPEQASELARGLLAGRSFSEADWTGQGRPFTRPQFRELRGVLLERGILCWRSPDTPQQGVMLTVAGRQVFRRLGEELPLSPRASACVDQGRGFVLPSGE